MLGFEYRWLLLHPLVRGALLSVGLAALCTACLWLRADAPSFAEAAPAVLVAESAADHGIWPRAVLRLWILAPQLLPVGPR